MSPRIEINGVRLSDELALEVERAVKARGGYAVTHPGSDAARIAVRCDKIQRLMETPEADR